MISTVLDELTEQLPAGVVVVDPEILDSYRRDRADLVAAGTPGALMRPTSTAEVATSMRWASHHGVTVVARGAGSGLSGGANAIDGCLMISLERMRRVREIAVSDQLAVVEAGVINADLGRAVAKHGLLYPPDPGSFEISTIGGNLATNAGGMRCVKYGVTRTSTLGLEVVLADGRVLHTGGRSIKNVAGLDLTQLFVGSEGTLGIITAATLRLQPAPTTPPATFVATFPTLASAGAALAAITASGASASVLEFMDHATINAVEDHQRMDLDRNAAALVLGQADATDGPTHVAVMAECCNQAGADFVAHTQDPTEADLMMAARRPGGSPASPPWPKGHRSSRMWRSRVHGSRKCCWQSKRLARRQACGSPPSAMPGTATSTRSLCCRTSSHPTANSRWQRPTRSVPPPSRWVARSPESMELVPSRGNGLRISWTKPHSRYMRTLKQRWTRSTC